MDREGRRDVGGGRAPQRLEHGRNGEDPDEGTDFTCMMHTGRPWRKRPRVETTSTRVLAPRRPTTSCASNDSPAEEAEEDDVGGGETHNEGYHRLRQ